MLTTAQFALNLSCLEFVRETCRPEAQKLLLVANHPFGGPAGAASITESIAAIRDPHDLPVDLRAKLDPGDPQLMPELVLNLILQGTGVSAVLPSMMRSSSLASNVLAVERCRFSGDELERLRNELIRLTPTAGADA
jgi:hypothetical protein